MNKNRKSLMVMLTIVLTVMLAACGNSTDKSSATMNKPSQNHQSTQNKNDSSNKDSTKNDAKTDSKNANSIDAGINHKSENKYKSNNVSEKETSQTNSMNTLREEYLKKLDDAEKQVEEIRKNPIDGTTIALKKVESDVFDIRDGLLNEIYEVLKEQLPTDKMEQLRKEQREWLTYRDDTSKRASLKYEGGTLEQYEYVRVENDLTGERCYELVEKYMK